jgi:hypothetical protein
MSVLLGYAAMVCVLAGLIAGSVAAVVSRDGRTALTVALDFWLAAGLLRLGTAAGWEPLLASAAIIVVRQAVRLSLRHPVVRLADVLHRPDPER